MNNPVPQPRPLSLLSVVIPARNEEGCIGSTVEHLHLELRLHNVPHEIIVVDDGSTDRTWERLIQIKVGLPELVPVKIEDLHGFGRAVVHGLDHMKGDAMVIMMADESDDCRAWCATGKKSATSGKAGGLTKVWRLKAAWPCGRRFSQPPLPNVVASSLLSPSRMAGSGERAGERGFLKTTRLLSPALHSEWRRGSFWPQPRVCRQLQCAPGTVKLYESSGRAGGLPV
jgi:hypothetical protein